MKLTMRRGDATVIWVSVMLAAVAVAGVAFSVLVLDREPRRQAAQPGMSTSSLLTLTWGPSLCTVERSNAGCRSGHVGQLGQVFVLHGLWPQPATEQYCDVPRRSGGTKPPVTLPDDLRATLQAKMSDAAVMATHEWYAHGTCSGVTAPEYFRIAAALTDQASTVLDPLFSRASGRQISARAVRDAFDAGFGAGAGQRVTLSCRDSGGSEPLVYEVRLSLPTVAALRADTNPVSLRDALATGPVVPPGCGRGQVP